MGIINTVGKESFSVCRLLWTLVAPFAGDSSFWDGFASMFSPLSGNSHVVSIEGLFSDLMLGNSGKLLYDLSFPDLGDEESLLSSKFS
jgi:hypothetical protein